MGNAGVKSLPSNRASSFDSGSFKVKYGISTSGGGFDTRKFSPGIPKRKRGISGDSSVNPGDDFGWFEDFESPAVPRVLSHDFASQPLQKALTLPPPATEPPLYILESSLETQALWYSTAGRRPKQPAQEREYFEKLCAQNFEASCVRYNDELIANNTTGTTIDVSHHNNNNPPVVPLPTITNNHHNNNHKLLVKRLKNCDIIPKCEVKESGEILYRGKAPFSHSVSKSFLEDHSLVASMTIHMPYFRIIRNIHGELYAEFLIVVTIGGGSASNGGGVPMTFGIWKRFSEFIQLAKQIEMLNNWSTALVNTSLLSQQQVPSTSNSQKGKTSRLNSSSGSGKQQGLPSIKLTNPTTMTIQDDGTGTVGGPTASSNSTSSKSSRHTSPSGIDNDVTVAAAGAGPATTTTTTTTRPPAVNNNNLLPQSSELENSYIYKNSLLSWQCVLQRKRWFKSLDQDYLALKCFLLERFVHDVLFESPTSMVLVKFLGLEV